MESLAPIPRVGGVRPTFSEIWRRPLDALRGRLLTRLICRLGASLANRYVLEIRGLENMAPERDPFILTPNHSNRLEAFLLPSLLIFHRRGRMIRFLADWPMMLVPIVATIYRCGEVIVVHRKSARPRFLNVFKPLVARGPDAYKTSLRALAEGSSVGIFPEATTNRDPRRLLRGQSGAARLAIKAGVPLVPAGIRFPRHRGTRPISDREKMIVEIGQPLHPQEDAERTLPARIQTLHHRLMMEISRLSGKDWHPRSSRRKHHA